MTNQDYLKEDQAAINKIKSLLESGEEHNIELAFQLLKGGGMAKELTTHLYALSIFYDDNESLMRRAKLYYKNLASDSLYNFTKYKWNVNGEYYGESEMSSFLVKMEHPELDNKTLANMALQYTYKGVKYCLEHKTAPAYKIIEQIIDQDSLDLDEMELNVLPKEIGQFNQIKYLYLEGNHFTDIPDELAQLSQLESLNYGDTPLTAKAIEKLENFFPEILAMQYYLEIEDDIAQGTNKTNSLKVLDKVLSLDPTHAIAWNCKGLLLSTSTQAEAALESFDEFLKYAEDDTDKALAKINKALTLQNLARHEQFNQTVQEVLDILKGIPPANQNCEYHFSQGLALFFKQDYDKALEAYDKGLAMNHDHEVLWYNKACTYAKQQKKEEMLKHLEQAIDLRPQFRKDAAKDDDFKEYQQDKDFLLLLSKEENEQFLA